MHTVSSYTFDATDADLILRPSPVPVGNIPKDHPTEFRVHKCVLAIASPIFKDMLSLPQPTIAEELPVVDLTEPASTIHIFLQFIYPIRDPDIPSLSALVDALAPALKYEASAVIDKLRKLLVSTEFLRKDPFHVYAIAARFKLKKEVKIAATHTLSVDILQSPNLEDYKYVTAYDFHRLLSFHRRCSKKAMQLVDQEPHKKCKCGFLPYDIYKQKLKEELATRPVPTSLTSLMKVVIQATKGPCCSHIDCWQRYDTFQNFAKSLGRKIDRIPLTVVRY